MTLTRLTSNRPKQPIAKGSRNPILYVEDDNTNWEIAELALREKFKLTRASTAREVFIKLRSQRFDLILMDIQLSGSSLDGIAITQILKGHYNKQVPDFARDSESTATPIVFMTAYTARYSKKELLLAGGDDLISKPVDFVRLSLVLTRLIVRGLYKGKDETG